MKYPEVITAEILQRHAHIPSDKVEKDIADTRTEIVSLQREIEGYQILAEPGLPGSKMANLRLDVNREGIRSRQEFIAYLERLLAARKDCHAPSRVG
jgi:hypothetical protein